MEDSTSIKSRIAKNTLMLYFRTFITMIVGLYTSRVILHALGESDYGVYNVVGGIVGLIGFINGALSGSSSRYLTYALGSGNREELAKIFSASLNLHILIAGIIVLFGETGGLWLLYNKLVIPPDKMQAAFWVLQFSIITSVFSVTSVPYNASLISHENMSVFAYMGLYDVFAKLAIAFSINLFGSDKLFYYALFLMLLSIISIMIYRFYAIHHYPECRFRLIKDKSVYKKISGYSVWDMTGNIAVICQGQGISILLNMFFGPVANAARAIASQILSGVTVFVGSFMTASRPRVIKFCAEGNHENMYRLTFITGKISFFLVFFLSLPVLFELRYILRLWLGDVVPPDTYIFSIIIIITALLQTFHSAFLMSFHAIGRIKSGNLINGTLMILSLPISYLALKLHAPAYSVFVIILVINAITHVISWIIVYRYVKFDVGQLLHTTYIPCVVVSAISLIAPMLLTYYMQDNTLRFFLVCIVSELIFLPTLYVLGFSSHEKKGIINPMLSKVLAKIGLSRSFAI